MNSSHKNTHKRISLKISNKEAKLNFKRHISSNGSLCAYGKVEGVPFAVKRVFTVWAKRGEVRGMHAHKKCAQLIICIHGKIAVECDDGMEKRRYVLNHEGRGILIPPGIWAKQRYLDSKAVMLVLCDRKYEKMDYIRNYTQFKVFKKTL
jgi:dTDP-4-dehydrorhamnose 3,5-epimerase-like enzyme